MSTLTELGDYVEAVVTGAAGLVFLGSRPDSPDSVITLYQYPGGPPEYAQETPSPISERVQIQVVTRARRYEDADLMAARVWIKFASVTNQDIGGTHYRSIRPNNTPGIMGRDSNDRVLVFFNSTVEKEVSLVA